MTGSDIWKMSIVTLSMLMILNLAFVYFSPYLLAKLPPDISGNILSCYRTFYHSDLGELKGDSVVETVFGDSYSEGAGDEF